MFLFNLIPGFLFSPFWETSEADIASSQFDINGPISISDSRVARIADGNLFVSNDLGSTWTQANDISDAADFHILVHSEDELIVVNQAMDKAYVSLDQGLTFNHFQLPENSLNPDAYNVFSINHHHPDWLIVNANMEGGSVALTKDSGKTWQYYGQDHWNSCNFVEGGNFADDLIHCKVENRERNMKVGTQGMSMIIFPDTYYTTDFSEPFTLVEGDPYHSTIVRYGDILTAVDSDTNGLAISHDGVHFNNVDFPSNLSPSLTDSTVKVQNSAYFQSRGSLLLFEPYLPAKGRENGDVGAFGNVLMLHNSNEVKLLLENVASGYAQQPNFAPMESEEGVFIATVVANPEDVKLRNEAAIYKSVITFDGGENWGPLQGPNGKDLHLIIDDLYTLFYRYSKNATCGIFSANGNEGDHLAPGYLSESDYINPKELHSYLTHDAGHTWNMVNKASSEYVISGHGSIIIEKPSGDNAVDHVKYSLDKGSSWHKYKLGFKAEVYDINTDDSGSGNKFLLTLHSKDKGQIGLALAFDG